MSVRMIELKCDVPECRAYCCMTVPTEQKARERAAERAGWTTGPEGDRCGPCSRGEEPYR